MSPTTPLSHSECVAVLQQRAWWRVRVVDVDGVAPALGMGQPQQQGVQRLVELLPWVRGERAKVRDLRSVHSK